MSIDVIIPFLILLILVIYLIYTRSKFEKEMLFLYEKKFEDWKKHQIITSNENETKELVGLVFRKNHKIIIELIDEDVKDKLQRSKFEIKRIGED